MDFCFTKREKEKIIYPRELQVLILFQNIAYTSSKNYQKWFYNKYFIAENKVSKRERSYSLDSEIDFDECLTNRKINKSCSLETIFESYLDDFIEEYYSSLPSELIPYFEENLEYFPKKIESLSFDNSKIKYFIYQNQIFISFMFPKNISLSKNKIKIDKFLFSSTLIDIWENIKNNYSIFNFILNLISFDKIFIVSHYKNTIITDFIIYKLSRNLDITYLSILPQYFNEINFYKELDYKINYYLFSNINQNTKKFIKMEDNCSFCCGERINYRKNLKRNSIEILKFLS